MSEYTKPELTGKQQWADTALAKSIAPQRTFGTHKWDVGGVVVIAGSPLYTGAAQLCTRSAGRAGAGIVHLAAPRGVITTIAAAIPDLVALLATEPNSRRDVVGALKHHAKKSAAHLAQVRESARQAGVDLRLEL